MWRSWYRFDKADWPLYEEMCREKLQTEMIWNAIDPIFKFNETVISIADETIPKTSTNPKHPSNPCFNDCKDAIKNRKKAERQFGKHPTSDNLGNSRIVRAKARRTLKQNRCTSWRNFVSKLNSHISMNKVWNMVQNIKGKNNKANVYHLKDWPDTSTSEQDISNKLVQTFSKNSSTKNYHKKCIKQKEKTKLNFISKNLEEYNRPFSLDELRKSLDKAHGTACGPDDIHYQLLKHLPESALQTHLDLMNDIWKTGDMPSMWKLANVIPIPKPGKDHS